MYFSPGTQLSSLLIAHSTVNHLLLTHANNFFPTLSLRPFVTIKILPFQVNDVEISPMSHEQAVQFLRQCGEEVKLRLYRDDSQTPVAALSPTETTPRTSFSRKSNLR